MHRIGRDNYQFGMIPDKVKVIFSFGEIDCRCHIGKYLHERDLDSIISDLVVPFERTLQNQRERFLDIGVLSVPPPAYMKNIVYQKDYPISNTDEERSTFTRRLNCELQKMCKTNKWTWFNVYPFYCEENGMLIYELSDKSVHIGDYGKRAESEFSKWNWYE